MTNPAAILFADSHLQHPGAWVSRPTISEDSFHSFKQLIDKAIELQVPLIGAGDLIDRQRNDSDPIVFMIREMERLWREAAENLYFTQGQHEMQSKPWFDSCSNAVHIHGEHTALAGVGVMYGIDFQPHGRLEAALEQIPDDVDLLVMHQVWGEFMGNITSPQGLLCNLPGQVRTVLTGDFHQHITKKIRNVDGEEMRVLSPGSTCMQEISEPDLKYFFVLMHDGTVESHELYARPVIRSDIMTMADDVDMFVEDIGSRIEKMIDESEFPGKPLIHVKYAANLADVKQRVTRVVDDRAHVFLKEIPPDKEDVMRRRERREELGDRHASTLESELSDYLKEHEKVHLEDVVRRLLEAPDKAAEMTLIRQESLGAD